MAFAEHKILEQNTTIQDLADAPSQGSLTAQQLKAKFDEFPELLRQKLNALIDDLGTLYPEDEELRQMQARLNAYAAHDSLLAGTGQAGHVRLDGRTITLNEAGQLVAQGAAATVASYEQALAGQDNSATMTPLRVKQAIEQGWQGLNYSVSDICALSGKFSAFAWHPRASLLAVAQTDTALEQPHTLAVYSVGSKAAQCIAALPVEGPLCTLLWNEAGDALAYLEESGQPGWALWDSFSLQPGTAPQGTARQLLWRPDGLLVVAWQNTPTMLSLYQRQGSALAASGNHSLAGVEEIGCFAYMPQRSDRLAVTACKGGNWVLLMLRHDAQGLTEQATLALPAEAAALAWHPGGEVLAVAFAAGVTALALYAAPPQNEAWQKLHELAGGSLSGLTWQGEGHYLALSRQGEGPLYELYACDGAALLPLLQALWQGQGGRPSFHYDGRLLAVLSEDALRVLGFSAQSGGRWLEQADDFTAVPGGAYFLPPGAAQVKISCFAHPEAGQHFDFWGDYPNQAQLQGVHGEGARGRGLYRVVFLGGEWLLLPLSAALADAAQAEAATDDTLALTPYGGGRLLAKRGRRTATITVAAADSLHKEAADFICAGQSDQLVIRAALAALPESGGKLVLLEGTYTLDAAGITPVGGVYRLVEIDKPYVTLVGMGKATRLHLADNVAKSAGQQFCLLYANAPGLTLRDCQVEGNKSNGNSAAKVTALQLSLYAEQGEVQNCVLRDCSEAGLASAGLYAHIHHNWLMGNLNGLAISGGENSVAANDICLNSNCGIYASGSTDMLMHNRIMDSGKNAIELRGCVNSHVGQNTLIGNSNGIMMYSSSFIVVKDNFVRRALGTAGYSATEQSLWLENCTDMMIVGNWLRGKEGDSGAGCARIWASYGGTDWNPVI